MIGLTSWNSVKKTSIKLTKWLRLTRSWCVTSSSWITVCCSLLKRFPGLSGRDLPQKLTVTTISWRQAPSDRTQKSLPNKMNFHKQFKQFHQSARCRIVTGTFQVVASIFITWPWSIIYKNSTSRSRVSHDLRFGCCEGLPLWSQPSSQICIATGSFSLWRLNSWLPPTSS